MMYNYKLTRVSCFAVVRFCFCAGACLGGLAGIALGLLERSMVSVLGGMFFGLVVGLISAVTGLVYAAVFNVLAPVTGGLAVRLDPAEDAEAAAAPASDASGSEQPGAPPAIGD